MTWLKDLSKSNKAFLDLVWPTIRDQCGGGDIKPVEMLQDNDLARDLDVLCGIDAWQTIAGHGCRGIASRVQQGATNWGTFTIRARRTSGTRTEYAKRLEAIQSNGRFLYPYLTCHAYVSEDWTSLLGGGLTRTVDIFDAIEKGMYGERKVANAEFYWVHFSDMADAGYRVYLFGNVKPSPPGPKTRLRRRELAAC